MKKKPRWLIYGGILLAGVAGLFLLRPSHKDADYPYPHLILEVQSPTRDDAYQLFYDIGEGFRERDSKSISVKQQEERVKIQFRLPENKIRGIRIDPESPTNIIKLRSIILKTIDAKYAWTAKEMKDEFENWHDVGSVEVKNGILEIQTNGKDPFFQINLNWATQQNLTLPKPSTGIMSLSIGKIQQTHTCIKIQGWALINQQASTGNSIFVVLQSPAETYIFDSVLQKRPDVTKHFQSPLDLDDSGFISQIRIGDIKPGRYKVGIYIRREAQDALMYAGKFVDIADAS